MNIAGLQYEIIWEDPKANFDVITTMLSKENKKDIDVVVLPEMFNTGFSMNSAAIAESMDGPSIQFLQSIAVTYDVLVIASLAIKDNGHYYNRCVGVTATGVEFSYDKKHLFAYANEDKAYSKGASRVVFDYKGVKICPLVCYDLRFPLWSYNDAEIDVYIYMANWPETRVHHWSSLLVARAIENQAYVVGVNRVGQDGTGYEYNGRSAAVDYNGVYSAQAYDQAGIMKSKVDVEALKAFRRKLPFLKDQ